jgi:hypothetical protein
MCGKHRLWCQWIQAGAYTILLYAVAGRDESTAIVSEHDNNHDLGKVSQ